jgi:hypothetical protein
LTGKHASYVKSLSFKNNDTKNASIACVFNRHIDVYIAGAIIGAVMGLKADVDNPENADTATIFAEQIIGNQALLKYIYHCILLTENSELPADDRIDRAFRYDADADKVKEGMEIFNAYARGGIEWLYDKFTNGATTRDDYLQKINEIITDFADLYNIGK